jgi:IMP cyclohydrolase
MDRSELAGNSEKRIKNNEYPGRGMIIGMTQDERNMVQVYWIMGRSVNSRNRIFEQDGLFVRTKAFDEKKLTDPSLIIYYPIKSYMDKHIVTNGDQTETILEHLMNNRSFEQAVYTREFEPDRPNYTPRISGMADLSNKNTTYIVSIIKSAEHDPKYCQRMFFSYETAIPGLGHCIHTYNGDGDPLPSFSGEPYPVPLFNDIDETAGYYWSLLNETNKVSLLAKYIDRETGKILFRIINRNK